MSGMSETEREALGVEWLTFRRHRPAGAYLPVGHLDGDCRECGEAWPCTTVCQVLDRVLLASRDARLAAVEALAGATRGLPSWADVSRDLDAALHPDPSLVKEDR